MYLCSIKTVAVIPHAKYRVHGARCGSSEKIKAQNVQIILKQFSTGVRESSFMGDNNKMRSILEIMNDVLSTVRDYYDSEYAYYIEKDEYEILTIYEWCGEYSVAAGSDQDA